jgi:hypothetical protein
LRPFLSSRNSLLFLILGSLIFSGCSGVISSNQRSAQVITFGAIPSQTVGATVALAATASSGLPVSFASETPLICTVSGAAATFSAAGTCTIQATQAGNSTYASAAAVTQSFTVNPVSAIAQTISFTDSLPATAVYSAGLTYPISATGGGSGNPVTFTVSGPATLSAATLTITGTGTVTVTANQAAGNGYAAARPATQSIVITAAGSQTITFTDSLPSTAVYSAGLTYPISATGGGSGNPVTFTVSGPATLSGSTLSITGTGTVTVTANQAAGNGYAAATPATQSIVITAAGSQTITFTDSLPSTAIYSSGLTYPISASGGGSGNPVTFTVSGPATLSGSTLTITGTGTVTVTANQAAGNGYAAATPAAQSIVITTGTSNPVPTILAIMPAALRIGDSPQTITLTGTNFIPATTATYGGTTHAINYVSSTTLTMTLSASDIASIGTFTIALTNPAPGGGSVSTPFYVFATSSVLNAPSVDIYRPTWTPTHAYYIDSNLGNDNNNGTSATTAWKNLTKIHNVVLVPGDVVYLARNSVWTNQSFYFDNGSAGSSAKPIVIEAYGTGNAPTISFPAAVWSSSTPYPAFSFAHNSTTPTHDLTILDLLITDYANTAISLDVSNYDIVIAGNEMARTGMGVGIHGQHQKVIANYIHDGVEVINDGNGNDSYGANGVGVVGQDIEIAWNRFINCSALSLAFGNDGGAVEFFGNEPTAADPTGWAYVSNNIRIHHNLADYTDGFMESTGAVNGMVVAYNLYINSVNEALEFHMDNSYGSFQNVKIEHNTFVPRMDPNPGGWGIVGELVNGSTPPTGPQSITMRNNIFATNFKIVGDNPIGANLTHDHNTFWLLSGGSLTGDPTNFKLDSTEQEVNPLFVDYVNLNLQLQSTSPAIGAAVALATGSTDLDNELVDLLGTALPAATPDEGAYQHSAGGNPTTNPAPTISSISPSYVVAGSAAQAVTVTGTGFLSTTTATVNGSAHAITSEIPTSLQLTLSASDQASVGNATIELSNPAPGGGTASISLPIVSAAQAMVYRSQLAAGDQARLQNLIVKARNGQKITIAAIGGSITEGVAATAPANRYLNLFQTWWNGQFSAGSTLINAGIGATDSDYGSLRVQRDVLSQNPDLVIVEFAVNDIDPGVSVLGDTYEGLLRQLLDAPSHPAVILLFMMTYPTTTDPSNLEQYYTAQPWQSVIGAHYNLPMVSYADAIYSAYMNGSITAAQITPDYTHPTNLGHAYAAQFLEQLVTNAIADFPVGSTAASIPATPTPLYSSDFEFTSLVDGNGADGPALNPTGNSGWAIDSTADSSLGSPDPGLQSSAPGSTLDFTVNGKDILLSYWVFDGPMGQASVTVDNAPASLVTLDSWFDQTWGGYRGMTRVANGLASGTHTVHVDLLSTKDSGSTGNTFRLLAVGTGGVTPLQSQSITFPAIPAQIVGTPLTLSATATSGLPVSYAVTSTPAGVCSLSGAIVSFAAAGTCTVQATQAGNSSYLAATPVSQSITVTAAPPATAAITSFTASSDTVALGSQVTLSWVVTGASSLVINQQVGSVTGTSVNVTPLATGANVYTLTANSANGPVTKSLTINVTNSSAPTINSFTASAPTVMTGTPVTLTWAVTGASTISISPTVGTVTGTSTSVTPASTGSITYTLTATNSSGSSTSSVVVVVTSTQQPPVVSLSALSGTITLQGAVQLSWTESGATSLTIDQGVGSVPVTSSSINTIPTASGPITYTITATNGAGSTTSSVTVNVIAAQAAPTATVPYPRISAAGTGYVVGSPITLNFATPGATTLSIDHNVGPVSGTSTTVMPTTAGLNTYTLTATNGAGSASAFVTVNVAPATPAPTAPVINSFTAANSAIAQGSPVTLTWSVTGASSLSIDQGVGTVTGQSVDVTHANLGSNTYTLTAANANGNTTAQVTVVTSSTAPTPQPTQIADCTPASMSPVCVPFLGEAYANQNPPGTVFYQAWGAGGEAWPEQLFWQDVPQNISQGNDMIQSADSIASSGALPLGGNVAWGFDLLNANGGEPNFADYSQDGGYMQYAAWMDPREGTYFALGPDGTISYPGQGYISFSMPMLADALPSNSAPETFGKWAGKSLGDMALAMHLRGYYDADFFIGVYLPDDWHPRLIDSFESWSGSAVPGATVPARANYVSQNLNSKWIDFVNAGQVSFLAEVGNTLLANGVTPVSGGQLNYDPAISRATGSDPRAWKTQLPGKDWLFLVENESQGDRATPADWTASYSIGASASRVPDVPMGVDMDGFCNDTSNPTAMFYNKHLWLSAGWTYIANLDGSVRRASQVFQRNNWDGESACPDQVAVMRAHVPTHAFGPAFYYSDNVARFFETPVYGQPNYYYFQPYLERGIATLTASSPDPQLYGVAQGINLGYWISDAVDPSTLMPADIPSAWLLYNSEDLPAGELAKLQAVAPVYDLMNAGGNGTLLGATAALNAGPVHATGSGLNMLAFVDQNNSVIVMVTNQDATDQNAGALVFNHVSDGSFNLIGLLGTPSTSMTVTSNSATVPISVAAYDTVVYEIPALKWIGH